MAEGTKDLSTDMQMAAGVKPGHKVLAIDPETGKVVGLTPNQLGGGSGDGDISNLEFNTNTLLDL